jgi:hypothetical protein
MTAYKMTPCKMIASKMTACKITLDRMTKIKVMVGKIAMDMMALDDMPWNRIEFRTITKVNGHTI